MRNVPVYGSVVFVFQLLGLTGCGDSVAPSTERPINCVPRVPHWDPSAIHTTVGVGRETWLRFDRAFCEDIELTLVATAPEVLEAPCQRDRSGRGVAVALRLVGATAGTTNLVARYTDRLTTETFAATLAVRVSDGTLPSCEGGS